MTKLLPAALLTATLAAGAASATGTTPVSGTVTRLTPTSVNGATVPTGGEYESFRPRLNGVHTSSAGVYGVELRRGNNASNGDWEVGVGQATSNVGSGNFNQGQWRWAADATAGGGITVPFTLSWTPVATTANPTGLIFTLGSGASRLTVASPGGANSAFLIGDTIKIYARRDTSITITDVDGNPFDAVASGLGGGTPTDLFFYSSNNWGGDGLTVTGTVRLAGNNGSSGNGVLINSGNFTPDVPEPASWALLTIGFGLTGAGLRRRRPPLRAA